MNNFILLLLFQSGCFDWTYLHVNDFDSLEICEIYFQFQNSHREIDPTYGEFRGGWILTWRSPVEKHIYRSTTAFSFSFSFFNQTHWRQYRLSVFEPSIIAYETPSRRWLDKKAVQS